MKKLLIPAVAASLLTLSAAAGALPAASSPDALTSAGKPAAARLSKKSTSQADACVRTGVMQTTDEKSATRRDACDAVFDGLDRALKAGAGYDLSPPTLAALEKWRRAQFLDDDAVAQPWHVGPAHLEIFPDLAPVDVPAGYQVLLPAEVATAAKASHADADANGQTTPIALMIVDASRAVVTLSLQPTGHVRREKLSPDRLLHTLAENAHPGLELPSATPSPEEAIARVADRVEWIKAPAPEGQGERNDWIYTTGHHSDPAVTTFAMPVVAARWVLLGAKDTLVADYTGAVLDVEAKQTAAEFGTVWSGLTFRPGARYSDAAASAPGSNLSLADLVTRDKEPGQVTDASATSETPLAQGLANAMRRDDEERSAKMSAILWKGLILALPLIGLMLRKRKSG